MWHGCSTVCMCADVHVQNDKQRSVPAFDVYSCQHCGYVSHGSAEALAHYQRAHTLPPEVAAQIAVIKPTTQLWA
jgi:hypothetical protein